MASKLAKDLVRGDIIIICDDEKTPLYRALITGIAEMFCEPDRWHIQFVRMDMVANHQHMHGHFYTDHDDEYELYDLPSLEAHACCMPNTRVPNDYAIGIAEEAFTAGYKAGRKGQPEVTALTIHQAWSAYEPSERIKAMTS